MLELCARAIFERDEAIIAVDFGHPTWEDLKREPYRRDLHYIELASAVIETLMTPTSEMVLACWQNHHPWGRNAPPPSERPQMFAEMQRAVTADLQAMLRSILTQSETQEKT